MIQDFSIITVVNPDRAPWVLTTVFTTNLAGKQDKSEKNVAGGYLGIASNGKVDGRFLPYGTTVNTACAGDDERLDRDRILVHENGTVLTGDGNVLWR